jgi:hypothetical protein
MDRPALEFDVTPEMIEAGEECACQSMVPVEPKRPEGHGVGFRRRDLESRGSRQQLNPFRLPAFCGITIVMAHDRPPKRKPTNAATTCFAVRS